MFDQRDWSGIFELTATVVMLNFRPMVEGILADLYIPVDESKGLRVTIHKTDTLCSSAQGFKPQGTSTCEEVKDRCPLSSAGNDIEQRFSSPIGCRSNKISLCRWWNKLPAFGPATDDPQLFMMGNKVFRNLHSV